MNVTNRRIAGRNSKGSPTRRGLYGEEQQSGQDAKCATQRWFGPPWPGLICGPAIPLPAFRRDKPMHSERANLAPGLSATADLGAQLKGDAVTHCTPKAPCEKERRDRSCRRRARPNPTTLCFYILRLRRLRSLFCRRRA